MSYAGIGGHYWDKNSVHVSRGEYLLEEAYSCEFGEPAALIGTGITRTPFNKRYIKSYDAAAGIEAAIGVFIQWLRAISTWTAEDYALHGSFDMKRDITVFLKGACSIKNMGSGEVEVGDTVVPVNGGFEKMTTSGQHSLGKALQKIESLQRGLIFVDPDYEKSII